MSSVSQTTRITGMGKSFKGILMLDIIEPKSRNPIQRQMKEIPNPIQRQMKEIPIRYWLVEHSKSDNAIWQPSKCENNTITNCFVQRIQFRIHNKAKYAKFLPEEFKQLCKGPSMVLCDGIDEDILDNYFPYIMNFYEKPLWTFYMATNSCNQPMDFRYW